MAISGCQEWNEDDPGFPCRHFTLNPDGHVSRNARNNAVMNNNMPIFGNEPARYFDCTTKPES
ncbi:MAG: hypothetical protein OEY27_04330, partial [Gammaproteobacteria bacterium]|nr:hypothetical protein [Gammaproteobacteria bacterium]